MLSTLLILKKINSYFSQVVFLTKIRGQALKDVPFKVTAMKVIYDFRLVDRYILARPEELIYNEKIIA